MNNEVYENPDVYYDEAPADETSVVSSKPMTIEPITFSQSNNRVIRKMEKRVEVSAAQERCRARLAQEAIVNTTALCSIADAAVKAVPSAKEPIKTIVYGYANLTNFSASQSVATLTDHFLNFLPDENITPSGMYGEMR